MESHFNLVKTLNKLLFFRCQNQERRITVTLRSTEGELGDLVVTVVAALSPYKAAKVRDGGILGQILDYIKRNICGAFSTYSYTTLFICLLAYKLVY